jgi:hypothetical protein
MIHNRALTSVLWCAFISSSAMAGGESSGERGAWEAASTVFRIAKVGLSLASAVMTATSKQCAFRPDGGGLAGAASYSDYGSLQ